MYKVLKIPPSKRSSVYYKSKLEDKDLQLKEEILKLQHSSNIYSFYGAKRISDHFRVLGTVATLPISRISEITTEKTTADTTITTNTTILPGTKLRMNPHFVGPLLVSNPRLKPGPKMKFLDSVLKHGVLYE